MLIYNCWLRFVNDYFYIIKRKEGVMKTFETNKAVVDIIAWPENRKWVILKKDVKLVTPFNYRARIETTD